MKNSMSNWGISILAIGILTACQTQNYTENLSNEKNTRTKQSHVYTKPEQDTSPTMSQKFIQESEAQIKEYDNKIAELRVKIDEQKPKEKDMWKSKLAELEKRNRSLETQISNYENKQIDDWNVQQHEFRKDLNDVGNSIAGFFNQN